GLWPRGQQPSLRLGPLACLASGPAAGMGREPPRRAARPRLWRASLSAGRPCHGYGARAFQASGPATATEREPFRRAALPRLWSASLSSERRLLAWHDRDLPPSHRAKDRDRRLHPESLRNEQPAPILEAGGRLTP